MPTQPNAKPPKPYDADALYTALIAALGTVPALLFSGAVGTGKSTILASAPVPKGKARRIFDHEDSMKYLDGGPSFPDLYTPAHQKFRMTRIPFPLMDDYAKVFAEIKTGTSDVGVVCVDNVKLLQDSMVVGCQRLAKTPEKLKEFMAKFDCAHVVPQQASRVTVWERNTDAAFWEVVKAPFKELMLECARKRIMFLASTEEGNVWQNYGQTGQKIAGKKGKFFDVWLRYADAVILLSRDVNTRSAPKGAVNPHQTKMRIQGLNPTWVMDWTGFIAELESARLRSDELIPEEAKVNVLLTADEPEEPTVKQQ